MVGTEGRQIPLFQLDIFSGGNTAPVVRQKKASTNRSSFVENRGLTSKERDCVIQPIRKTELATRWPHRRIRNPVDHISPPAITNP
jgi:hypothetical protein